MTFVSYAQNFEDVMLWRALKDVEKGFYIDVGANDPIVDSVTKPFYDRGWRGINIEPLSSHWQDLIRDRPDDINLQCAAGAAHDEIELWECDIRGWATADKEVIAIHRADGHEGVFHKVQVLPLLEICAVHVKGEIHFLKIDVEGFEKSVIEGMDFVRFRPWILVVEATRPNSTEEVHGDWEDIVLSSNYLLAYTDGLNRFYVAKEHSEILAVFRYPPNVFDGFVCAEQLNSEIHAKQAEEYASHEHQRAAQLNDEILVLRGSISWRITAPIRYAGRFVQKLRFRTKSDRSSNQRTVDYVRESVKRAIRFVGRSAMENSFIKRKVLSYLFNRPALKARLRRIVLGAGGPFAGQTHFPADLAAGSVSRQKVCRDFIPENGSVRRSLGVNNSQKTPLESYFY